MKKDKIITNNGFKKFSREGTGIKEVDSMIEGGFPENSVIGLSGPPGVGKSIFTMHFLLEGARKGEKCLYINLEEPEKNINNLIMQFDFSDEFKRYINEGKIIIKCYSYNEYEQIYLELFEKIKEDNSLKRIVIDTFNCFFSSILPEDNISGSGFKSIKKTINEIFSILRAKNSVTLVVLEDIYNKESTVYYNIPHLVDGMINLDFLELGTIERRIFIPKMRWTNQYKESRVFEINVKGINILEGE